MANRYFKKLGPNNPVVLPIAGGVTPIEFSTVDGLVGYFATDKEEVQQYFVECMKQQRYGLTEISFEEFTENYIEKKNQMSVDRPPASWREEMLGSSIRAQSQEPVARLGSEKVRDAVTVRATDGKRPQLAVTMETAATSPTATATTAKPAEQFKGNVGKRKAPKS